MAGDDMKGGGGDLDSSKQKNRDFNRTAEDDDAKDDIGNIFESATRKLASYTMVNIATMSREERRALRKRLKRDLEAVRSVASRLDARIKVLRQPKDVESSLVQPELGRRVGNSLRSHDSDEKSMERVRSDGDVINHGAARPKDVGDVTSDTASSSGETHKGTRVQGTLQREAGVAGRPPPRVAGQHVDLRPTPKRTPKANQIYLNSEFVYGEGRIMPPPEVPKTKRIVQGKAGGGRDPRRQDIEATRAKRERDVLSQQCMTILKKLINHKHGWVFSEAVDGVKLGLPDYHTVITKPMDLGTIKKKLNSRGYLTPAEFAEDVQLTFANAMTYNPKNNDVHTMAVILKRLFDNWWKGMEKKLNRERRQVGKEGENMLIGSHVEDSSKKITNDVKRSMQKDVRWRTRSRPTAPPKPRAHETNKRLMTLEEKKKLSKHLATLPDDKTNRAVEILKRRNIDLVQNGESIEIEFESCDNDTLWELDRMVTNYLKSKGKKGKSKAPMPRLADVAPQIPKPRSVAPAGMESRAGLDEDVDVGDDAAAAGFPSVIIDKAIESSSSSDSSSSGSSDSDSDSSSSSSSESHCDDAHSAGSTGSKAALAQKHGEGS